MTRIFLFLTLLLPNLVGYSQQKQPLEFRSVVQNLVVTPGEQLMIVSRIGEVAFIDNDVCELDAMMVQAFADQMPYRVHCLPVVEDLGFTERDCSGR